METSTIIWIGGIAVVAVGAYLVYSYKKEDPKDVFLKRESEFSSLLGKLSENELSIEKWTEKVVSINNKTLTRWWANLVSNNNRNSESIRKALAAELKSWGVDIEPPANPRLAKKAFIANIEKFAPILDTLNNQTFNLNEWTEVIVSVNDTHLTRLWKKYVKVDKIQERWKQLLASWQIKSDTCKSFTCNTADNVAAYNLPNGDSISIGVKYKVESPCWVVTIEDTDGKISKRVVNKGIVTPIETV